ncbi:Flp pilus assembly complex ATPase component TadA [Vallitalea pronyensis]|uniref:Flp pilus assembly complex ATPase component TadA n=1 Tax=Vallitalea pronyensis TaxID=1348613 RepID=A0A8J8MPN9_9FIRM|nr:ATPase, T2SS/T4P/T4SS family [Vallitalea pronyensis]QUI25098.1 Flp pilus assembly complex ATPase component TadA [Vallitalea pronyensis]
MTNTFLTIALIIGSAMGLTIWYYRVKNEKPDYEEDAHITFEKLVDTVKYTLADLIKDESFNGFSDDDFKAFYKRKARIQDAMNNCVYGIDSAKVIVQDLIRSVIMDECPTVQDVNLCYDFYSRTLDTRVKFEILLYFYKKEYGKGALAQIIDAYNLDRERYLIEDKSAPSYAITAEDIDMIYGSKHYKLTYPVLIDLLTILVYQQYKGFGILDTLREMDINGFNCGTSGSILSNLRNDKQVVKAPRSVWLYFRGKYIHMRFLTFGTEQELRRVIQLICRYNNPGPLTEKRGYLVNTMFDKSRVLALRPPAAEYWAVFVRKFSLSDVSLKNLIEKPYVNNANLAIHLLQFLMMGQVTCGVTGRQGSGKTTLMTALIEFIDPKYTLRVLEMAPEMYLRELYPERNILSVQETEFVSASDLQDALKKSDAAVSIVGEVATDPIAARMIQMGQVASIFTIFSHHANRAADLVRALRNSLVNAGGFTSMVTAEQQVIDIVRIDVHLNYTTDGKRYIERISEIIKLDEGVPYPDYLRSDPVHSMNTITKEYYTRITDRQTFTTRDILKYDLATDTYTALDWFSPELTQYIMNCIPKDKRLDFSHFVQENWEV